MAKSLVLTLGHNSSAILVIDGKIICGYEEERFTGIKSDSSFPLNSIQKICNLFGASFDSICVGHWFTAGQLHPNKYVELATLATLCKSGESGIHSIRQGLTHHDTHLMSAQVFANCYGLGQEYLSVVADGFGTFGECFSVYTSGQSGTHLLDRFFGYGNSLGMLYQYATAYLGMKMHNHEYKMLGYEAHIDEALSKVELRELNAKIIKDSTDWIKRMFNRDVAHDTDPVVNKSALAAVQHSIANVLDGVLEHLELGEIDLHRKRIIIAYYVQSIVEEVMVMLVKMYHPKKLLLTGGLFYNVKLNQRLSTLVEQICVMPLAGDQGAGLGVYQAVHHDLQWPGHLFWGHRDLDGIDAQGVMYAQHVDDAIDMASIQLQQNKMVNIVRGAMEFGPRSLCNTATLALPQMDVVERINKMNDRTTIMPMAPAMLRHQAVSMLRDVDQVVGSLNYMIITRTVNDDCNLELAGASHFYPQLNIATCRPQIIGSDDYFMSSLLNAWGPLINTSFNYHGVPIVFDSKSVEYSHSQQNKVDQITTIIL